MANHWPPTTIADYYRAVVEQVKQRIASTPDDQVLGMDLDAWVDYLVQTHAMNEIEIDESRQPPLVEVEVEQTLRGYDIYSDRGPGDTVRSTRVRVAVAVVPSETLAEIWKHKLAPNQFSMVEYPEYAYDPRQGIVHTTTAIDANVVRNTMESIKGTLRQYNTSIQNENGSVRSNVLPLARSKQDAVRDKHSKLDSLAAAVGIPLVKKADPARIVPTVPKVRPKIVPVLPPVKKQQERPVLDADKFVAICELIDNQCRGFERTPQAFAALTEEGLRDIILGSLNAVFEGAAAGETFQGVGKVDIHLRISQGEVFVAEVKFWSGASSLHETLRQLRERLTWRDSYGVAIMLSKNAGFSDVLKAVAAEIPTAEGYAERTLRNLSENHFAARFTIPSDGARQAELHVFVYNLYAPRVGKRQTKREPRA